MKKKSAKKTAVRVKDWNNATIWKLEARIDKLLDWNGKLHAAAVREDTGFIRATAQSIYDQLHDFADLVDDAAAARERGELPPIK